MVWKAWAPPKIKLFAWLTIRGRVWMVSRLEKSGWNNCGLCPLCKQTQEMMAYLFSHCRYSNRLWEMVKNWLGIYSIQNHKWTGNLSIKAWCLMHVKCIHDLSTLLAHIPYYLLNLLYLFGLTY
jgi:hypothetical protein